MASHTDTDWNVLALFKALIKVELQYVENEIDKKRSNPPVVHVVSNIKISEKDFQQRWTFLEKKIEIDKIKCNWGDPNSAYKALERNKEKYPSDKTLECLFQLLLKERYSQYNSWKNFKEKETTKLINTTQDVLDKRFREIFYGTDTRQAELTINVTNNIPSYSDVEFYDEDNSSLLSEIDSLINNYKIVCLYGVPGVGKSFLAMKVAVESQGEYDLVWILSADNVSTIENSLEKFAERIFGEAEVGKEKTNGGIKRIIERLRNYLADKSWLLVYDNAGDNLNFTSYELRIKDFIENYFLHKVSKHEKKQKILLATRNEDWVINRIYNFGYKRVEYWNNQKIKSFLEDNSQIKIDDESQLSILEGIPLIASIAKEVIRNSASPSNFNVFLKKWEKEKEKLLRIYRYQYDFENTDGQERVALATTIELSYENLSTNAKELLKTIAHFSSNDIPYSFAEIDSDNLFSYFYSKNSSSINKWVKISEISEFNELLHRLSKFSLLRNKVTSISMHEFIQTCVLLLEEVGENAKNYNKAIQLLINVVADWGIASLPHADQFLKNLNQYITYMSDEEKNQAAKLFSQSGQLHSQQGHNKAAEEHFRKGLEVVTDDSIKAELQKKLAKILFLKGKKENGIKEALDLSKELLSYYESHNDWDNIIYCYNELQSKIYQRLCQFQKSENALNKASELIEEHKPNYSKYSTLYHDYGSLYWTWGRKGDYRQSAEWFEKAIAAADNDFSKAISRMIYGAVLGLLEKFDEQEANHRWAFDIFKARDEERRYTYTSYYQLSYGWDKEKLTGKLPTDFNQSALLTAVRKYQLTQSTEEKCNVIYKIIRLRVAVRDNDTKAASEAHSELWEQLEEMKYGERYYDVDTCSVSAFLDYAQFLKDIDRNKAIEVTQQARNITKDIEYHRMEELNQLATELNII